MHPSFRTSFEKEAFVLKAFTTGVGKLIGAGAKTVSGVGKKLLTKTDPITKVRKFSTGKALGSAFGLSFANDTMNQVGKANNVMRGIKAPKPQGMY